MTSGAGIYSTTPLHVIFLVDASGSMWRDDLIRHLNNAFRNSIEALRNVARRFPQYDLLVRAVRFGDGANWHIGEPTSVFALDWQDVWADGATDLGAALRLVARELKPGAIPPDAPAPILVLFTDGYPTDDFALGMKALLAQSLGRRSRRFAIALGPDGDNEALQYFLGEGMRPIAARTAVDIWEKVRHFAEELLPATLAEADATPDIPEPVEVRPRRWRATGSALHGPEQADLDLMVRFAVRWSIPRSVGLPLTLAVSQGVESPVCLRGHIGAQLAAQIGSAGVLEMIAPPKPRPGQKVVPLPVTSDALPAAVAAQWRRFVNSHFERFPFTEEEMAALGAHQTPAEIERLRRNPERLYGATLASVVMTESSIIALQIGAGDILVVTLEGEIYRPFVSDGRGSGACLGDDAMEESFRVAVREIAGTTPALALCCSQDSGLPGATARDFKGAASRLLEALRTSRTEKSLSVDTYIAQALQREGWDDMAVGIAFDAALFEDG